MEAISNHQAQELASLLKDRGADLVGYANLSGVAPDELADLPYGVSIGLKLLDSILDAVRSGPTMTYYHHYRTVNMLLDQLALSAARRLEDMGGRAVPIPASQTVDAVEHRALFPHKTAARLAGLGWIGRSALLVTPDYGPRVRFTTVLTNVHLPTASPELANGCLECHRCVSLCPAGAFTGRLWEIGVDRTSLYDAHKCSKYMRANYGSVGRGSVCGICVSCCPYGNR